MFYYLRKFGLFKGIVGFVITAYPFVARFAGLEGSRTVPPLDYDLLIIYVILLVMLVFAGYSLRYVRFFTRAHWATTVIAIVLFLFAGIGTLQYIVWQEKAIRCGEVKPEDSGPVTYCVIIGLERSQFAKKKYSDCTDQGMLRKRAWTPEQVRRLWTPDSIETARRRVIGYYLAVPVLFLGTICVLVVRECIDEGWGSRLHEHDS